MANNTKRRRGEMQLAIHDPRRQNEAFAALPAQIKWSKRLEDFYQLYRGQALVLVDAAYRLQVNSRTGYLESKRQDDRFITATGEVLHSDVNAARDVRDRIHDSEITQCMPFDKDRKILLRCSSGGVLPFSRPE